MVKYKQGKVFDKWISECGTDEKEIGKCWGKVKEYLSKKLTKRYQF